MTGSENILQAFVKLGNFLNDYIENPNANSDWHILLKERIYRAEQENKWFTQKNIHFCLQQWGGLLNESGLQNWLSKYTITNHSPKSIAIIMAGNIPLVGFHDFLCVLLSGNHAIAKLSSNDTVLFPTITEFLIAECPEIKQRVTFLNGQLENYDAVIATGSNNTGRYFEYYFGKKPHIIRKNRNSVAVLTGKETNAQLAALGEDIFRYFGLGCRSVSKVFVPQDYSFEPFFEAIFTYKDIINVDKYANNYDYNKAVYLMSNFKILDNGFLIVKEDEQHASPISVLFYEYYDAIETLKTKLTEEQEQLQCIVAINFMVNEIPFGQTQQPQLNDYADGVDTIEFLTNL